VKLCEKKKGYVESGTKVKMAENSHERVSPIVD
jgi:hypothetical protein